MGELLHATGFQRVHRFLAVLDLLAQAGDSKLLATAAFRPDPDGYRSSTINQVLALLADHLADRPREADVASYANREPSAFSRFFRRHSGMPFVQYLGRLRIDHACELLIASERSVTDICHACGFNNVSNFNRHFLAAKAMPPSQFRRYHAPNAEFAVAAA